MRERLSVNPLTILYSSKSVNYISLTLELAMCTHTYSVHVIELTPPLFPVCPIRLPFILFSILSFKILGFHPVSMPGSDDFGGGRVQTSLHGYWLSAVKSCFQVTWNGQDRTLKKTPAVSLHISMNSFYS